MDVHHEVKQPRKTGLRAVLDSPSVDMTINRLCSDDATLTTLAFGKEHNLSTAHLTTLFFNLKYNHHLQSLHLTNMGIKDYHLQFLYVSLRVNTTLEELCLDGNALRGEGILRLLDAVSQQQSLQHLRLLRQPAWGPATPASTKSHFEKEVVAKVETNNSLLTLTLLLQSKALTRRLERKLKENRERGKDASPQVKCTSHEKRLSPGPLKKELAVRFPAVIKKVIKEFGRACTEGDGAQ